MGGKSENVASKSLDQIGPVYTYKFRDRAACPSCGFLQFKSQTEPDYLLALVWNYVEVKNGTGDEGRWTFKDDISEIQRERLSNKNGWLFIELGPGRRGSDEKGAFLIPYLKWEKIEKTLGESGQSSLTLVGKRNKGAAEVMSNWKVVWNSKKHCYVIPDTHDFWTWYLGELHLEISRITNIVNSWEKKDESEIA